MKHLLTIRRLNAPAFASMVLLFASWPLTSCVTSANASDLGSSNEYASNSGIRSMNPLPLQGVSDWTNNVPSPTVSPSPTVVPSPTVISDHAVSLEYQQTTPTLTIPSTLSNAHAGDRFWLVSTRHLTYDLCRLNLRNPDLSISRLDRCGRKTPSNLDEYLATMTSDRPRFVYVHGNRRSASVAITQGLYVYRQLAQNRTSSQPIDWVIWSWPSDNESMIIRDARIKADRADSQALYLAWLLRHHHQQKQPSSLIGFSFGARVVTGSLHALAGGTIRGRNTGEPVIKGAPFDVGLLAPAIQDTWLSRGGKHQLAPQNMNRMVLLYNHRDMILKYYWLVSRIRGSEALGYTGPRRFTARFDGTALPVRAKDCANTVGTHHSEKEYYKKACYAGREMASLIDSTMVMN